MAAALATPTSTMMAGTTGRNGSERTLIGDLTGAGTIQLRPSTYARPEPRNATFTSATDAGSVRGGGGRNSSRGYRHAATSQPESDVVPAALVFEENQIPYVDAQAGHGRIDVTVETWGPGPGCVQEAIERVSVDVDRRLVVIRPYHRLPEDELCFMALVSIEHETSVAVIHPGTWTVRVIGTSLVTAVDPMGPRDEVAYDVEVDVP